MTDNDVLEIRDQLWDVHPVIREKAILPTPALKNVISLVWSLARKARGSIAFFARPLSGKSSCAKVLRSEMQRKNPGCGVVILEVVEEDRNPAEGRLLSEILNQIDYALPILRDLAGKRTQVHRALFAKSGNARHLFLIFDEAQEISAKEFAWLKAIINRLVRDDVAVTVVLFGQEELKQSKDRLKSARSDLEIRFMDHLYELRGLQGVGELRSILESVDSKSEYPDESGISYTQFLLPRFFGAGKRLEALSDHMWKCLNRLRRPGRDKDVPISIFAAFLAALCIKLRYLDAPELEITDEILDSIVVSHKS